MKFRITKDHFSNGLQQVLNVVGSRSTMPILSNVLIELGEYAESEAILRETLVLQREVLGPEHPVTKQTAENLQTFVVINI